ncbi:polymorphic toxin type 15 domain-containing protein [Cellulomonas cellasea]|uniref:Novel toxin 15 domain-containing protein n=2 Tax=Cellulomonas cellasea TaxID=43670 RepID=A0A0A0B5R3_9CELL|nr:polymorphic toxin type 15 domain-containing protein [Cellulomonas cellasea]KGM01164.1 hypothetical protein Q760_03470 [Cellulomonas cellasea DSM 20118]GEA88037.1 hypothetical protein CCE01nite_19860 [Cellulomonas cellasea]
MTVTPTQCVADGGLINPALFPAKSADLKPEQVRDSATSVKTMGTSVQDETSSIAASWSGLTHSYEAPEQQRVYDLMRPAVTSANELKTAFHTMAGHLETYAAALDGIKPRLASFEQRAAAFRAEVINGVQVDASSSTEAGLLDYGKGMLEWAGVDERQVTVPWYEDGDTVQRNKDLLAEYAELLEDVSTASAQCANDINGLVKNMCVTPVEVIPAEAFTNPAQPMPWGEPREEDRNCPESVGSGAYTFGKDLIQGAGQLLLGYNPETGGWFEGKAYGQAWGGLGDLVGSIALFASPVAWVAIGMQATGNTDNDFVRFMDDRYDTAVSGLGSLVGYDHGAEDGWHKWKEDGVAAGTGAVLSIGTFFIPGAGQVGTLAKGGSIAARVTKMAAVGADFAIQGGSWVVKGGIKLVAELRSALAFGGELLAGGLRGPTPALAGAGAVGGGFRISMTGLVNALIEPVPSRAVPHRPAVSNDLFGPGAGRAGGGEIPPAARGGSATPSTGGRAAGLVDGVSGRGSADGLGSRGEPGTTGGRGTETAVTGRDGTTSRGGDGTTPRGDGTTPRGDGTSPEGTAPRGDGTMPEGTTPRGDGTTPEGTAPEATTPHGDGTTPEGTAPEGTTPRGDGTTPDGTTPDGNAAPTDGTAAPANGAPHGNAPDWDGNTVRDRSRFGPRPDVADVPVELRGDPRFDPAHPHYDAVPRGEHGNVGTENPDVPSDSGLTNSGRLIDPDVIPEDLRPYVEDGTVVVDNGVLRLAEDVAATPFERTDAAHDPVEFARQLDLQQRAINQMSLHDWTSRFDSFTRRLDNQGQYRSFLARIIADRLQAQQPGLSRTQAMIDARARLAGQDPLHGPDQRAGGNPWQFTGMGDDGVNRSIGSQWKKRSDVLRRGVGSAIRRSGLPPELWGDVRMNVRLTLVDHVGVR